MRRVKGSARPWLDSFAVWRVSANMARGIAMSFWRFVITPKQLMHDREPCVQTLIATVVMIAFVPEG